MHPSFPIDAVIHPHGNVTARDGSSDQAYRALDSGSVNSEYPLSAGSSEDWRHPLSSATSWGDLNSVKSPVTADHEDKMDAWDAWDKTPLSHYQRSSDPTTPEISEHTRLQWIDDYRTQLERHLSYFEMNSSYAYPPALPTRHNSDVTPRYPPPASTFVNTSSSEQPHRNLHAGHYDQSFLLQDQQQYREQRERYTSLHKAQQPGSRAQPLSPDFLPQPIDNQSYDQRRLIMDHQTSYNRRYTHLNQQPDLPNNNDSVNDAAGNTQNDQLSPSLHRGGVIPPTNIYYSAQYRP